MLKHPQEVTCSVENHFSHPCTDTASSQLLYHSIAANYGFQGRQINQASIMCVFYLMMFYLMIPIMMQNLSDGR